mmetsp:Transcript_98372/g.158629  ORF Transcript_98372/g.158629 Transcript_98372/m.158629 type:complete len:100 (+) Transcript_98372:427-726(+)
MRIAHRGKPLALCILGAYTRTKSKIICKKMRILQVVTFTTKSRPAGSLFNTSSSTPSKASHFDEKVTQILEGQNKIGNSQAKFWSVKRELKQILSSFST